MAQTDRTDAVEEVRTNVSREVAEIRTALAALRGSTPDAVPSFANETAAVIVEQFRETYSRLDVDELFDKVRSVAHGVTAKRYLATQPALSRMCEHLGQTLEKRLDELKHALERLGKEFDGDGAQVLTALADALEVARSGKTG
jgi:uncharacterized membrane protein YccC